MVAEFSKEESLEVEKYNINDLERHNRLGKGGFCNVYLVNTLKGVLKRVAMKELHLEGIDTQHSFQEAAGDLIQEAQILTQVSHSNIVGLRGISDVDPNVFLSSIGNSGTYFILLDVMLETLQDRLNRWYDDDKSWKNKASTLLSYRKAPLRRLPKEVCRKRMIERIRTVAIDVADAMAYLHKHNIIFQDLKPENIGFEIETDELKIFDFGMARSVHPVTGKIVGEEEEMICGTPRYFAPEIFDFSGGSKQTDVYAFGIMLHEICSMRIPFGEMDEFEEFREHVCAGGRPNIWEIPDKATREVIRECTLEDPEARPSFSELLAYRLPELLVEQKELESPRSAVKNKIEDSSRTGATEVVSPGGSRGFSLSRRNSFAGTSIASVDLDENDDVGQECSLPQEFDHIVPRRSSTSNQSMPRMRCGDEEATVNSRGLGRSTHSTTSDFLSSDFMLAENDHDCSLTDEQKQQRQERLQRQLARKKRPKRRRLKGEERQKKQNKEREELRCLSLAHLEDIRRERDDDNAHSRDSGSDTDLNMNPPIPRNLTYDDSDDDSVSFADDVISLNDEAPSLNDYAISLNGALSIISRVSDDCALDLTQYVQNVGQEIPLPPPPPPPLPSVTPRDGLDSSAHGTRKKRRKKKKGIDSSTHTAYSSAAVSLADDPSVVSGVKSLDSVDIQPPPPPPPLPTVTPRDGLDSNALGTKTNRRKKKKELDSSAHSAFSTAMVSLADDRSVASTGTRTRKKKKRKEKGLDLSSHSAFSTAEAVVDDKPVKPGVSGDALDASEGQPLPPPPPPPLPPQSPQLSTGTKTRKKKKKKDKGMDYSGHSVFSAKSAKSEDEDALLLGTSQHNADGLTPRTRRKKKKKGGKKKDSLSENSNHTKLETIMSPEVSSPKKSRSKSLKSRTRKKNKLEVKLVEPELVSQPVPLDPATEKEDAALCPTETNADAMLQNSEDPDDPPKEESPQNFSWWRLAGIQ